jgi:predicted histone-like DNA-binding protein
LSELISKECTLTAHDVKAVISALEEHVTRALLDGKSLRLGDLGSFHPTVKSKGADAVNKFKSKDIEKVNVRFVKNGAMRFNFSVARLALNLNLKDSFLWPRFNLRRH